ncbi:MAG: DUF5312 family protein [Spirochaetaceae bacterium]|jgi:hypothetical protein|nr:DUF5312 family protein [Spirochaetaceae bacterium]
MADDIFDKVFSVFSRDDTGAGDQKHFLRQVQKALSTNKYGKFYKLKTGDVDVSFAYFIYDIYRTIVPVTSFMKNPAQLEKIRQITVEAYLDKASFEIAKRLRPEVVSRQVATANPQEYTKLLQADMAALTAAFDRNRTLVVNRCYALISAFCTFANFDFEGFLKKFDPGLKMIQGYIPKFLPLKGSIIAKHLEAFRATAAPLNVDGDWKTVFAIFKTALNGVDLIPFEQWQSLVLALRDVQNSGIMDLICQETYKDPLWQGKVVKIDDNLVQAWFEAKRAEIQGFIGGIADNQRGAKVKSLANAIFGTFDVTRLLGYTVKENAPYVKNGLDGLVHAAPLNYLSAFMEDFIEKELQDLCDILLIRGQWTNITLSREMSDAYNVLKDLPPVILEFDENLADTGKDGPRLKNALFRVDRDKSQVRYINSITAGLNDRAEEIISSATGALVVIGRHLKQLIDDFQKKPNDLVINWKELGLVSKSPLLERMQEDCKKVNYFVQLMQISMA